MSDSMRYTRQTIEMDNNVLVDVEADGKVEFYREENEKHFTILEITAEDLNRVNRIIYSGRITPEGYNHEPQKNFYPSRRR
jgi:hypothetical protein